MQSSQVIACSKIITLHSLKSRQPTSLYNPHKGIINSVHINHTNKVIASCGQDGRIVLVNAQKPDNQVFETSFHSGTNLKPVSVNCIMFSSMSHYIAAGASDSLIKIWDMKNHKHVYSTIKSHIGSVTSLGWIKNIGQEKNPGEILASSSSSGDIFLHSVKTSNIVKTLNSKNQEGITQIKISQSEGHCRLAASTSVGSVMVWDIRNLQKTSDPFFQQNNGKKSSITSVSFSSFNPILIATASVDQNLTFYDVNEKKSVKTISSEEPLTSINFHTDGHTMIAGGMYGNLFVYDLRKLTKSIDKLAGHDSAIKHTVFIKQYEGSSSLNESRSSKASSVTSYNSSNIPSSKSIKESDNTMKEVKPNVMIDNLVSTINNNSQKSSLRSDSIAQNKTQNLQNKRQTTQKLSVTGQQVIKNSQLQRTLPIQGKTTTLQNQQPPQPYNYYNKPQQVKGGFSNTVSGGFGITKQAAKIQLGKGHSIQPIQSSLTPELRDFIEQKFETLHMQMIRQFHLQQVETKQMINEMLIESGKKNDRIRQLQKQIKQLKYQSY